MNYDILCMYLLCENALQSLIFLKIIKLLQSLFSIILQISHCVLFLFKLYSTVEMFAFIGLFIYLFKISVEEEAELFANDLLKHGGISETIKIPKDKDIPKTASDEDYLISEMIKTLKTVEKYAKEGNDKFSEHQENLEKLIKETDPKTKFVDYLDEKILNLETSGKLLEEHLYIEAEINKKIKQELDIIIKQKNKIQLENEKLRNSLKTLIDIKVGNSNYELQLRGITEEHKR